MEDLPLQLFETDESCEKIAKWLQEKQIELIDKPRDDQMKFLNRLFDFILNPPSIDVTKSHLQRIDLYLCEFILSMWPIEKEIPPLRLDTEMGPLFSALVAIYLLRGDNKDQAEQIKRELANIKTNVFSRFHLSKRDHFYNPSQAYYLRGFIKLVPTALQQNETNSEFRQIIQAVDFCANNIVFSDMVFIFDVMCILLKADASHQDVLRIFNDLFVCQSSCPNIVFNYFFANWRYLYMKFSQANHFDTKSQLQALEKIMETISFMKHPDINRTFQWNLCFTLYDLVPDQAFKRSILKLVCHYVKAPNRFEVALKFDQLIKAFSISLINSMKKTLPGDFFYYITSVISNVSSVSKQLLQIKGINIKGKCFGPIKFSDQKTFVDDESYKKLEYRIATKTFIDMKEALAYFDKNWEFLERTTKFLHYGILFNFECPIDSIINYLNDVPNSSYSLQLHFFMEKLIETWISLLIVFSHRIMFYQYFQTRLNQDLKILKRNTDFQATHRKVFEYLKHMPEAYHSIITNAFVKTVAKYNKKQLMSKHFLTIFNSQIIENKEFGLPIILKMLDYFTDNLKDFLDINYHLAYSHFQFFVLFALFAKKMAPESQIGSKLICHQKLLVNHIIYIKFVPNHIPILETIKLYTVLIQEFFNNDALENWKKFSTIRPRKNLIDEFQKPAQKLMVDLFFNNYATDHSNMQFLFAINFLTEAFSSSDPVLIGKAVTVLKQCINKDPKSKYFDIDSDFLRALFTKLFSSIHNATTKDSQDIIEYTATLLPHFFKPRLHLAINGGGIIINPYNLKVDELVNEIQGNLNDSPEESVHLFLILQHCFEEIMESSQNDNNSFTTLYKIISMITNLARFPKLHDEVVGFFHKNNEIYAEKLKRTGSSMYFVLLLNYVSSTRSYLSQMMIKILHNFLDLCGSDCRFLSNILSETFEKMANGNNIFSMFMAIGLIMNHSPTLMTPQIMDLFLTFAGTQLDQHIPLSMGDFLDHYCDIATQSAKKQYIEHFYEVFPGIHWLWKRKFLLVAQRMNTPIDVASIDIIIKNDDIDVAIFQFIACIYIGTKKKIVVTKDLIDFVMRYISKYLLGTNPQPQSKYVDYSFKLSILFEALLLKDDIAYFFLNETVFRRHFAEAVFKHAKFFNKYYRSIATIIYERNYTFSEIFHRITKVQENLLKDKDDLEKLGTHFKINAIMFKTFPEKLQIQVYHGFYKFFQYYINQSAEKKTNLLYCFEIVLKLLAMKFNFTRKDIQEFWALIYGSQTYLEGFISNMMLLFDIQSINYKKIVGNSFKKIVNHFPEETTNYLLRDLVAKDPKNILKSIDIMRFLIIGDENSPFLSRFLNVYRSLTSTDSCVIELLNDISKDKFNRNSKEFKKYILSQFVGMSKEILLSNSTSDYIYINLNLLAKIYIRYIKAEPSFELILNLCVLFFIPSFMKSNIYYKFIAIFRSQREDFYIDFLKNLLNHAVEKNVHLRVQESLYGNCIRMLSPEAIKANDELIQEIMGKLFENYQEKSITIISTILLRIIVKKDLKIDYYKSANAFLYKMIQHTDPHMNIHALKFAIILIEKKLISSEAIQNIVIHMLNNSKFFEPPFQPLSMNILKNGKDSIMPPSTGLIDAYLAFFTEKFPQLLELAKIAFVVQSAPYLVEYLPYSISLVIANIDKMYIENQRMRKAFEVEQTLIYGVKILGATNPSIDVVNTFSKICFNFIVDCLTQNKPMKEIPEAFSAFLVKYDDIKIPQDFFEILTQSKQEKYLFALVSCAIKFTEPEIVLKHTEFIRKVYYMLFEPQVFYKSMIHNFIITIIKTPKLCEELLPIFIESIPKLRYSVNEKSIDILFTILENLEIIGYHSINAIVNNYWDFLIAKLESGRGEWMKSYLKNLLFRIKNLAKSDHSSYIDLVKLHYPKISDMFIQVLPTFLQSKEIDSDVKIEFMFLMIPDLKQTHVESCERMIDAMDNQYVEDNVVIRIIILSFIAVHSSKSKRISCAEIILGYFESNPEEVFCKLIDYCPLWLWSDSYLAFIVLLLSKRDKTWTSLVAFSTSFKDTAVSLTINLFTSFVNTSALMKIQELFLSILRVSNKKDYQIIMTSLLELFQNNNIQLSLPLAYSATKISGHFNSLLPSFIDGETLVESESFVDALLYPHQLNDYIFGNIKSKMSFDSEAATAQFFLGNYMEANKIFGPDYSTKSPMLERIYLINKQLLTSPFIKIGRTSDKAYNYLELALKNKKNVGMALEYLQFAQNANIEYFKSHKYLSFFDKIRTSSIQLMIEEAKCFLNKEEFQQIGDYLIKACMNPLFYEAYKKYITSFKGETERPPVVMNNYDKNGKYIVFPQTMKSMFSKVVAYNSHGFIAVDQQEIKNVVINIIKTQKSTNFTLNDSHKWAILCYTVFTSTPSVDMMNAALHAYMNLISMPNIPGFIKFESSARVFTLFQLAIKKASTNYSNTCWQLIETCKKDSWEDLLQFWIRQIVILSDQIWFRKSCEEIKKKPIYYTAMYAITSNYYETVSKIPRNMPQILESMRKQKVIEDFFTTLFSPEFSRYSEQEAFYKFLKEIKDNGAPSDINLMEVRKRNPRTKFEKYLNLLDFETIEKIYDFEQFKQVIDAFDYDDLPQLVDQFIPSEVMFSINRLKMKNAIDSVNRVLPYQIPSRINNIANQFLLHIHNDIRKLSDDIFLVRFTSQQNNDMLLFVQRIYSNTAVTYSNSIYCFKQMIKFNYSTRIRSIRFHSSVIFEVGPNFIMYIVQSNVITLEDVFKSSVGQSAENWLGIVVDKDDTITDIGETKIAQLPATALKDFFISQYANAIDFLKMRSFMVHSYSASTIVQNLFSANYPSLSEIIICTDSSELPLTITNFNLEAKEDCSPFRLSPNIVSFFGDSMRGEMLISMAATAQVFIEHFESFRSCLEILYCDVYNETELLYEKAMVDRRQKLEQRIIDFYPPNSEGATKQDSLQWIRGIDKIIAKAIDSNNHPIRAIPWF